MHKESHQYRLRLELKPQSYTNPAVLNQMVHLRISANRSAISCIYEGSDRQTAIKCALKKTTLETNLNIKGP